MARHPDRRRRDAHDATRPTTRRAETDAPDPCAQSEAESLKKVLCVDDSVTSLMMVSRMLFREFEVVTARNGAGGLAIARSEKPDLILLDLSMPGIDGFEVCRLLRQDDDLRRIPILMLSAIGGEENRLAGRKAGCDDYLTKPVRGSELLARIRRLIAAEEEGPGAFGVIG